MTSLGETLRRERLKRNLELNRIAEELKISASMLKAIEEERFDKLPGGVFARSFVRQYARYLDLDAEPMVGELKRVLEPDAEPVEAVHAEAPNAEIPLSKVDGWQAVSDANGRAWRSSLVALGLVVAVILACAGAYEWWQKTRRPAAGPSVAQTVEAAPVPTPAVPAPVAETASAPSAEPSGNGTPPAAEPPKDPAPTASAKPAPGVPPPPTPAPATPPAATLNGEAAVKVDVVAQQAVWISVRTDGQYAFSGVLDANQSRSIAANQNVLLKIGNAGGVSVVLNGKPIGPLGKEGDVRTLQLTSGGFKIVPPDVPKPEAPKPAPSGDAPTNPL